MRFRSCLVVFMICLFTKGFSQVNNIHFKKLTNADGLSQSSITAITQDRFGQIWIGTRDGLNKYDGNHFTVYRNEADNAAPISNMIFLPSKKMRTETFGLVLLMASISTIRK